MTIDEAISHCLEVAEQNEISAITYKNCKEIKTNMYEKLTAEKAENDCCECAADHRQLAEWLMEVKDLREENKFLISEFDRLIKKNEEQIAEYKRLLKLAVEDLEKIAAIDECTYPYCDSRCPFECMGQCEEKHWKHTDEALKLIEKGEQNCGR